MCTTINITDDDIDEESQRFVVSIIELDLEPTLTQYAIMQVTCHIIFSSKIPSTDRCRGCICE